MSADEIGQPVLAPSKIVYTNHQGYMVLAGNVNEATLLLKKATTKWDSTGWKVFYPKGE